MPFNRTRLPGDARRPPPAAVLIARFCAVLCGVALSLMAIGITVEIISRNFFGYSIQSTEELSGYLIVGVTFLGLVVAVHENGLFRVRFVLDKLPRGPRRALEAIFLILFAAFLLLIDYESIRLVIGSYRNDYVASTLLATPLYIPQSLIPLGLTLALFLVLAKLWRLLRDDTGWALDDNREDGQ